jgi:hypothetical protein
MSRSNTFQFNNYSIVSSLNERTIYIKITDTVSFYQYEGNVDAKELRLPYDLTQIYTIVEKSFRKESEFNLYITVNSGILKLNFNIRVGGFLDVRFEILLHEKIMSNDGQLTLNFNRLEQQLTEGLGKLEKRCNELVSIIEEKDNKINELAENLSYSHICMCFASSPQPEHFVPINIKEITNFNGSQTTHSWKFDLIERFYQLEKLTISTMNNVSHFNNAKLKSKTLTHLTIVSADSRFNLLSGLQNIPMLTSLKISNCPSLRDIPTILNSYKHNITQIEISACPQVNVVEMQTYCQTNNIRLSIA